MHTADIDGVTWSYRDVGAGPLVVLTHGTLSSHVMFDSLVDELSTRFRCVVPDWPGHGSSGWNSAGWGAPELVEGLAALIDVIDAGPAVLVGLSQGGAVSIRVALEHPDRVAALVTLSAGPDGPAAAALDAMARLGDALARENDAERRRLLAAQQPVFHAKGWVEANPGDATNELDVMLSHPRAAMPHATRVPASYESVEARLPEIACRTLVVWGAEDVRAGWGDAMVAAIPGARLLTVDGAGHHVLHDQGRVVVDAVAAFLDEVSARDGSRA